MVKDLRIRIKNMELDQCQSLTSDEPDINA